MYSTQTFALVHVGGRRPAPRRVVVEVQTFLALAASSIVFTSTNINILLVTSRQAQKMAERVQLFHTKLAFFSHRPR